MASLSELLQQQHEQIMTEWAAKAHQAASARGLDQPELRNILPRFLSALADGAAGECQGCCRLVRHAA